MSSVSGVSENKGDNRLTEEKAAELMAQYRQTGDVRIRNELVMNYSYIARTAAMQLRGLAQGYAQVEDMVSNGMLTLIDCVEKFDGAKGMKFESYAFMRVRGGVIDLVRKQDWIPRRVRNSAKEIANATSELYAELKRQPTEEELAAAKLNLQKNLPESRQRNNWWLNSIELYLTYGVDRDAAYEDAINNLSADSIKALAQEILSQENFIELVMKPAATAEAE